jgi:hypothetical protein
MVAMMHIAISNLELVGRKEIADKKDMRIIHNSSYPSHPDRRNALHPDGRGLTFRSQRPDAPIPTL